MRRAGRGIRRTAAGAGLAAACGVPAAVLGQAPSFQVLGAPPGYAGSTAQAISADGHAAAGYSGGSGIPNFRPGFVWTDTGGRYDYGLEPGLPWSTLTGAISANGAAVTGTSYSNDPLNQTRAFRWSGPGTF